MQQCERGGHEVVRYGAGVEESFKRQAVGQRERDGRPLLCAQRPRVAPSELGETGMNAPVAARELGQEGGATRGLHPELDREQQPSLVVGVDRLSREGSQPRVGRGEALEQRLNLFEAFHEDLVAEREKEPGLALERSEDRALGVARVRGDALEGCGVIAVGEKALLRCVEERSAGERSALGTAEPIDARCGGDFGSPDRPRYADRRASSAGCSPSAR